MELPKVSVIVPVYNVEAYLQRCVDSIVNQVYKKLEIILVDDGSPDNCGAICDEYAEKDKRIKVIHKFNGGLSSARNMGLAYATGEWIGWVDADDWIEEDMFGHLLQQAAANQADIAVCGQAEHNGNQVFFRTWKQKEVLSKDAAMELLLRNDQMQSSMCNKLWRRELFDGLLFPEDSVYEDLATAHRLFARAERVVCVPEAFYHYARRKEGITGGGTLDNRLDHFRVSRRRLEEMGGQWPQYLHLLEAQCAASAITVWCAYYSRPKAERKAAKPELKEISGFARQYYHHALKYVNLGISGRIAVRLVRFTEWWAFALAWILGALYQLKHGGRP